MQISPIPTLDDETNQIREMTAKNVAEDVIPNEHLLRRGMENAQLWGDLQWKVKRRGAVAAPACSAEPLRPTDAGSGPRKTHSSPRAAPSRCRVAARNLHQLVAEPGGTP